MGSNWSEHALGEIASFKYGKFLPKKDLVEAGYPVYSGYGVVGYLPTYQFEEEQLVIVCRGEGGTGDIKLSPPKCSITNLAIVISCNGEKVKKEFLYWALKLADTHSLRTGSAQAQIVVNCLERFRVNIPDDLDEQNAIALILSSFNNKIELNRQINQTLEQIAQTIFKSWFVDFEPVKAKIEAKAAGRDPERAAMCAISGKLEPELDQLPPEQHQQLAATAALFPDELAESDLGLIPTGWVVKQLGEVSSYLSRGISPTYVDEGGVLVLNQKCVRENTVDYAQAKRHDCVKRKIEGRELAIGDVLVNSTGVGTLGRVAQILYLPEKAIVDSHVTVVREGVTVSWNFLGLSLLRRQAEIEQLGEGSTGQTELSKSKLALLTCLVPNRQIINAFDNRTISFRQMLAINHLQNLSLADAREILLLKLLSGEVQVGGAS